MNNQKTDLSVFTNLVYQEHILCDEKNVIILDIPYPKWFKKEVISLQSQRNFVFVENDNLSQDLAKMIKKELVNTEQDTLLVFPGNGSCFVRQTLSNKITNDFSWTSIFAKRGWYDDKNPLAIVGEIMPKRTLILGIKRVLVIDDVISSGITMRKIYQRNYWKFPQADWLAATWLMQSPRTKAPSGVKGFKKVLTTILVQGSQGKRVPINSLSTLVQEREIAENYAQKHFFHPEQFIQIIQTIKNRKD